jgi:hypothetical protein
VLTDGQSIGVAGQRIQYSAETANLFEQAEGMAIALDGNTALAPSYVKGWRTYNFEVKDLHTYVAGGVRVHNTSAFTASGSDITVGTYIQPNGDHLYVSPDGTVTDETTGLVTSPAVFQAKYASVEQAEARNGTVISPSEQYDMASSGQFGFSVLNNGSGPPVQLATGKVENAGMEFSGTDGYRYVVNSNGSVTNEESGYTSGPGSTQYDPEYQATAAAARRARARRRHQIQRRRHLLRTRAASRARTTTRRARPATARLVRARTTIRRRTSTRTPSNRRGGSR